MNKDIYFTITVFTSVITLFFLFISFLYSLNLFYKFILSKYRYAKIKKFRKNLYVGQHCYVYSIFVEAIITKIEDDTVDLQLHTKYRTEDMSNIEKFNNPNNIIEKVSKDFIYPKE